jgi:hypothetical protein
MANNTDWLNISQMTGGTGETALSLTALTNNSLEPKTATITARNSQYNVSDTTTVTIQGFQPTLTLSRSTLRFDSTGGTATFTVYSNTAWTINFPAIVHSYSTSAGTGDTEVTVVLAPNPDEVAKVDTGIVKDVFNVNQLYLTIVQESFIVELYVEPDDDIIFANTGSSTSITIDSNADWELEYPSWVTPSITSGESGTTTVILTAGQNGPTDRSGEITVYAGSKSVTINVFQPFYIPPYITVTPSAWTFNYTEDGKTFIVDSYPEWTGEIISTAETVWESDIYMEATFEIPSAMTMPLWVGNSGNTTAIYTGPIREMNTAVTFPSSGTYKVRYELEYGGASPVLSGNQYLVELYFSDGPFALPESGYSDCTALSSVTFGNGIQTIGAAAFSGCSSLNNIAITTTVAPSICANTFYGVATGGTLQYPVGSNYNGWLLPMPYYLGYYGWPGFSGEDHITAYYEFSYEGQHYFFYDSSNIEAISIDDGPKLPPQSVYIIGEGRHKAEIWLNTTDLGRVFYNLTDLVSVTLPDFITSIGVQGFWNCRGLTEITLPDSLTSLPANVFAGCRALTSVTFGSGLTSIAEYAFGGCSAITSLIIPDSVTTIGNSAFTSCSGLTAITLPVNLTGLSGSIFKECNSLSSITIPNKVQSIGSQSFYKCSSLLSITCLNRSVPTLGGYVFTNVPSGGTLYYPSGSNYSSFLSALPSGWRGVEIN